MSSIAGRVAIVPQGEFVATRQYDRLDAVTKENAFYIAKKKPPVGTPLTDTNYWSKIVDADETTWGKIKGLLTQQQDLKEALDKKADTDDTYTKQEVDDMIPTSMDWENIENTPLTYPPSAHKHVISDVTDLGLATASKAGIVKPDNTSIKVNDGVLSADDTLLKRNGYGEVSGGRNIWDEKWENGYYNTSDGSKVEFPNRIRSVNNIPVKPNTTYYASTSGADSITILAFDSNGAFIGVVHDGVKGTFQTPTNCAFIKFYRSTTYGGVYKNDTAIIEGSSGTYEPYFPSNKELAKSEQEIVDLKVLGWTVPKECPIQNYVDSDGKFHQRVGRVDLGSLEWVTASSNRFISRNPISDAKIPPSDSAIANIYSNSFETVSKNNVANKNGSIGLDINRQIYTRDSDVSSIEEFVAKYKGAYLYYELANPISIPIDGSEVSTQITDLKQLGWTVPVEMSVKNSVSGNQFIQNVGRVDLGELTWTISDNYMYAKVSTNSKRSGKCRMVIVPNGVNNYYFNANNDYFVVTFTSGTSITADQIKNTFKEIYLYYELATPIETYLYGHEVVNAISDAWDRSKTYAVGDYCIFNGALWKCKVQHSGQQPTEGGYWEKTSVASILAKYQLDKDSNISNLNSAVSKGIFSGIAYSSATNYPSGLGSYALITTISCYDNGAFALQTAVGENGVTKHRAKKVGSWTSWN